MRHLASSVFMHLVHFADIEIHHIKSASPQASGEMESSHFVSSAIRKPSCGWGIGRDFYIAMKTASKQVGTSDSKKMKGSSSLFSSIFLRDFLEHNRQKSSPRRMVCLAWDIHFPKQT